MAEDTSLPLDLLDLNRTELVESFLAFLARERRRKERERPADLHSSVLILLLCVATIVTLFLLFLYWRNKYGVGSSHITFKGPFLSSTSRQCTIKKTHLGIWMMQAVLRCLY